MRTWLLKTIADLLPIEEPLGHFVVLKLSKKPLKEQEWEQILPPAYYRLGIWKVVVVLFPQQKVGLGPDLEQIKILVEEELGAADEDEGS